MMSSGAKVADVHTNVECTTGAEATCMNVRSPAHRIIRPRASPPPHCMRKVREHLAVERTTSGATFDDLLRGAINQPRVLRIRKRE